MKRDNVHSSVIITFQKPIIERDDGQNINSCMATHSEKTRVAQSVTHCLQSIFTGIR